VHVLQRRVPEMRRRKGWIRFSVHILIRARGRSGGDGEADDLPTGQYAVFIGTAVATRSFSGA
jgi:hypothetical protein